MSQQYARLGALAATALVSAALTTAVAPASAATATTGGPIILAGHDADDHGAVSVYAGLFNDLLSKVGVSGSGIVAVGADPGSPAGSWITQVAASMTTPQTVTFVNDAAIATVDFSQFAIVHVPSDSADTGGGITQAENDTLATRAADLALHVNGGGGLFGLTQGELTNPYAYLGNVGAFSIREVPPGGSLPSGALYDNVTATAEGAVLGISDTNLDGCCWHNVFTGFPSFLSVLATANEPLDTDFDGQAAVIGGENVIITPSTGRMTGGGAIGSGAARATHGFTLHCDVTQGPNKLQVNWGRSNSFHLEALTAAICTDNPALESGSPTADFDTYSGTGTGRYNGSSGARAEWTFTDAGEPGVADTASLKISDARGKVVLTVSGAVAGDQQAHN